MKVHWWSCVLGILCMPAEVMLYHWTVSQRPMSLSFMRVNSSVEITCSTSLADPEGLYLYGRFHGDKSIMYLSLNDGQVIKTTPAVEFTGRVHVTAQQQKEAGTVFTLHLSRLELIDTDYYYCSWSRFDTQTGRLESKPSNGTVIIITEYDPHLHCRDQIWDRTMICSIAVAFTGILLLFIVALILQCRTFKKNFRPARAEKPLRPRSPPHVCPQYRTQHSAYMVTSINTLDFRGIL